VRIVNVPLGARSYKIKIGNGLLATLGKECSQLGFNARCAVISDSHVAHVYGRSVIKSLRDAGFNPILIKFPPGESRKNLKTVQTWYDKLAAHQMERKSFIVALGGGIVGDIAGFVAAIYMRGIPFVQVPTTLLAQVDSSVGGKVGVNLRAGKNLIGAFHQPKLVVCDMDTLRTLPIRELRAGMAEVIKYGIIHDVELFAYLEAKYAGHTIQNGRSSIQLPGELIIDEHIIERCCAIKAEIVGKDETESGVRAILNFGHTIGHALEAISAYGRYLHGEAIAIGQVGAAEISSRMLGFPRRDVDRIRTLFKRCGLPTEIQLTAFRRRILMNAMGHDKKVINGRVKFVLAKEIGETTWGHEVPKRLINEALNSLSPSKLAGRA
jgi:3-dehydroquinate synthase